MFCIDSLRRSPGLAWGLLMGACLLTGCNHATAPISQPAPPAPAGSISATALRPVPPAGQATAPAGTPQSAMAPRRLPRPARHWDDYRLQAAERIVAANPDGSYLGAVPEPLLAIPVLEVELHADGSVRRIVVMRKPTQALDTVQLAIAAVQRAAPFGPVAHLPRPWKFTEVFLFDEQRRFKPRSLDL